MISITSEYGLYLYTGKVDMRKGIDGLCGIISEDLGHNPRKPKSVYVFSGRNPRVKKVLIREYNRYELTTIRLDEGQLSDLRKTISELTAQISALTLTSKVNAGKLYGRKSEKSSRLGKRRDDDDRNSGKDNFDGTAGSDSGANTEVPRNNPSSGDTVSAIRKRLLRTHPGSEVKVERIDYSKAAAYTNSPTYHRLEDYYKLPEGAYYVGTIAKQLKTL